MSTSMREALTCVKSIRKPPDGAAAAGLEASTGLAVSGVPLFTCGLTPEGSPLTPREWQKTPPGVVSTWTPYAALCAVGGHVYDFLDVDPRHGGDESLTALLDELGHDVPEVYAIVVTPSGGWHFWIAALGIGSRDAFMPGLDFKGGKPDGSSRGFVFIPPTARPSRRDGDHGQLKPYWWAMPPGQLPEHDRSGAALGHVIRPPLAPQRGVRGANTALAPTSSYIRAAVRDELGRVAGAEHGTINITLNAAAFSLARFVADGQLDAAGTAQALLDAALHAGETYSRATATIRSAFTARGAAA